ncbi:MAG: hypothetical protein DYH17_11210 [Xanthomonadales bacterium PRO6]|nr:hypothetical protein [Xanthomonadales bacterium]MCE7931935.1 hypothetical protein [Xanthomonadales bacterium PRO6]
MKLAYRRALSRGTLALLRLPPQRYLFGCCLLGLLWLAGWSLPLLSGKPKLAIIGIVAHGYVLMFVGLLSAMVWVSVCRPETQIVPGFKRALAMVWLLYGLFGVLLPAVIAGATGFPVLLGASLLALVLTTSIASGSGIKWAALLWLSPLLFVVWPEFAGELWAALRFNRLAPALPLVCSALILRATWKRLMLVSDGAPTLSPADLNPSDLSASADAARIRQAGVLAQWLQNAQYALSARIFDGVLAALGRGRRGADRRALGLMLMPNAHLAGVLVECLLTALLLGVFVLLFGSQKSGGPPIGMVASYIGLLTAMRFQGLHRATLMLRPSLVDVYFALAPRSQLDFGEVIVRVLYRSLGPSMAFAITLLLLGAGICPEAQRLPLLLGGGVGALASSLVGLGIVLMQLDAERPRMLLGLFLLCLLGSIPTALCVAAALASWQALAVVGAMVLAGAGGFLAHAHREATHWPIRFDAPL